ncbi:uncharacterized protein PG986_006592 [Apiospora aurea]|uniref:Uncharacterized protein n=1 Tax=Apiospora aurea TaxID=335848 RepID=A0ABR1QL33_9PEZI
MASRSISSSSGDERPGRAVVKCRRSSSSSSSSSSRAHGQQHQRKRSREDEEEEEDERAPKRPLTEYAATLASLDTPGEFEEQASEDEEEVATTHSETRGRRVTCHKKQLPRMAAKGRGTPSATDVYIARIEARLAEQELEMEALQDEVDGLRYENFERRYTIRELRQYIQDASEGSDIELWKLDRACRRRGTAASMAIGVFEIKRSKRRTLADDLKQKIRELQKKRQAQRKWRWDAQHETAAPTEKGPLPDDEGESLGEISEEETMPGGCC